MEKRCLEFSTHFSGGDNCASILLSFDLHGIWILFTVANENMKSISGVLGVSLISLFPALVLIYEDIRFHENYHVIELFVSSFIKVQRPTRHSESLSTTTCHTPDKNTPVRG